MITCRFCDNKFEHGISGNMIIICPQCKKTVNVVCDYGFGSIVPCDIYAGKEIIGTINNGYRLISEKYDIDIQLKSEYKNMAFYQEAEEIIRKYYV